MYDKYQQCKDCIHDTNNGINYCDNCNGWNSYHKKPFEIGQKVRAKELLIHADLKTASVHKDRYKPIEKGIIVQVVKYYANFYGLWIRVKGPNGSNYDVSFDDLEEI